MIPRLLTDSLLESIRFFPVTGIVGPRQVGKTTLAKHLMKKTGKDSVYVDLENPKDLAMLSDPVLFFEQNQERCVVLDEIQRKPELFPILRSMVDLNRTSARFIILGSASPDLIRDSSESLAGRIVYEELTPFNLEEVIHMKDIFFHWFNGGFPDSFLAPGDSVRKKWLSGFVQTYIERDLPLLGLNIDRTIIRRLWTMLAHLHGNVLNMNNLSRSLEVSSTSIKKYIAFLEEAFLVRQLQPFHVNIKKRIVKSPKVYIRDSGILHHLLHIPDYKSLMSNPVVGASWEGYAIEQIVQRTGPETGVYFFRTHEGAECDLVLAKGNIPTMAIEIKFTSTPRLSRGLTMAFGDVNAPENFIITPATEDYLIGTHTRVCCLELFLQKYLHASSTIA
ncbi:MAG: ATP-binding protein [Bacteroidota bacterium]